MTIGEKIKALRLEKGLTQADVASNRITRNMLSAIESNKSLPSFDTLIHISKKLKAPLAYLLSDDNDISPYLRQEYIEEIRSAFSEKRYFDCISLIEKIGTVDDELAYILAYSNYELGVSSAKNGSFLSAEKYLSEAMRYSQLTVYDTKHIECKIPLYMSFVMNVNFPLLDFDKQVFYDTLEDIMDYEFYNYLSGNLDYEYKNPLLEKSIDAKIKIKERKYLDAINILIGISESKSSYEYNVYIIYCVYGDLENCYKQIRDFENAYKYSNKRLSMLEGFNS